MMTNAKGQSIPKCPGTNCPRCAALHTTIGCGACLTKQSEAIGVIARAEIREGESFSEAIARVVASFECLEMVKP